MGRGTIDQWPTGVCWDSVALTLKTSIRNCARSHYSVVWKNHRLLQWIRLLETFATLSRTSYSYPVSSVSRGVSRIAVSNTYDF